MSRDLGELAEIRRELRQNRWYLEDRRLRDEVNTWIQESHEKDDADTAREYVEHRLNKMLSQNHMYHAPTLSRGEDAFPDECSDCRHYGSACPVVTDNVEVDWRERKLDQAESETEARRIYQQQAIDVGCTRIPAYLEEWDGQHAEFIRTGQDLLARVEEHIHDTPAGVGDSDDDLDGLERVEEAVADGGGPS